MPSAGNRVLTRRKHWCSQLSPPTWQREHVLTAALHARSAVTILRLICGDYSSRAEHQFISVIVSFHALDTDTIFAIYYLA